MAECVFVGVARTTGVKTTTKRVFFRKEEETLTNRGYRRRNDPRTYVPVSLMPATDVVVVVVATLHHSIAEKIPQRFP